MSLITVKVCTGRACSDRYSEFIQKRLEGDKDFYHYADDVEIETCMCQGRCKEGPVVIFGNDVQVGQNPIKASETLRRKVDEARRKLRANNKDKV